MKNSCCLSTTESGDADNNKCQNVSAKNILKVDACGLMCPGPIMQLKKHYAELSEGDVLSISATDQAFGKDVASWCKVTGAQLIQKENKNGVITALIEKTKSNAENPGNVTVKSSEQKTIIVFSDDLDKALASFVIANGAAAMGKKVTMFFTFWGLNVIKKSNKPAVSKDFFGKMFGFMLPSSSKKLALSKLNMGGMGSRMMRMIMNRKKIDSLESLINQAVKNNIEPKSVISH